MRIDRWFWLPVFCVISMLLHVGVAYVARGTGTSDRVQEAPTIEVAFEPTVATPVKPIVPQKKPEPTPKPVVVRGPKVARVAPYRVRSIRHAHIASAPKPVVIEAPISNPLPTPTTKPTPVSPDLPENIKAEAPDTTPHRTKDFAATTRVPRITPSPNPTEGGGSLSPAPVPGGHDGLKAPEAPKEDVVYTGGGRGGADLPNVAAAPGGGGGLSVLHAGVNPLGDPVQESLPGIGNGLGAGRGTGAKGGAGFATGKGIGMNPDGKIALGSLRRGVGSGIGLAPSGTEIGTKAPGGGRGRGAELPGTGGSGTGYGRGRGVHLGDGRDDSGPPRMRGVPFGDIASILGAGPGGTGGGRGSPLAGAPTRGAVFGTRRASGGSGPIHIVYALDISGSMAERFKIVKAKEALKRALGELRSSDTFNIIVFKRDAYTFQDDSVPATVANVANARIFVDNVRLGNGTNISTAMDLAFGMNGITQIYLMSDGEPNGGIMDFAELRRFIRERNTRNIKIHTLALGLGERFPGVFLLRGIAEDNSGTYTYVDMNKIETPGVPGQ